MPQLGKLCAEAGPDDDEMREHILQVGNLATLPSHFSWWRALRARDEGHPKEHDSKPLAMRCSRILIVTWSIWRFPWAETTLNRRHEAKSASRSRHVA